MKCLQNIFIIVNKGVNRAAKKETGSLLTPQRNNVHSD